MVRNMLRVEHQQAVHSLEQCPGIALALFSPSKLSSIRCGKDDSLQQGGEDCHTSSSMQTVPVFSAEYACRMQYVPARAQHGAIAWQGIVAAQTCTHA